MRTLLTLLCGATVACAGGPRSRISTTAPASSAGRCPTRPAGSDSRISLLVLDESGDTIRTARVRLAREGSVSSTAPIREVTTPSPAGRYELEPLEADVYLMTVSDNGRMPAHLKLSFCQNATAELTAVLVASRPREKS